MRIYVVALFGGFALGTVFSLTGLV